MNVYLNKFKYQKQVYFKKSAFYAKKGAKDVDFLEKRKSIKRTLKMVLLFLI